MRLRNGRTIPRRPALSKAGDADTREEFSSEECKELASDECKEIEEDEKPERSVVQTRRIINSQSSDSTGVLRNAIRKSDNFIQQYSRFWQGMEYPMMALSIAIFFGFLMVVGRRLLGISSFM